MIAPCTACQLLDGDDRQKDVRYMACCNANLCQPCSWSLPRRTAAMRRRDGFAGGLWGWLTRAWGVA